MALKRRRPVPADVAEIVQARKFWRELGVSLTDQPLAEWPETKVRQWEIILDAIGAYEAAEVREAQMAAAKEAERQSGGQRGKR
jgi:hypothetical protein